MGGSMLRPYKKRGSRDTEGGGELGEDEGIAGAAAGDDELVDFGFGKDEAMQRVDDGKGGEDGGGADEVAGLGTIAAAERKNFLDVGAAVVFAASGLGWREFQVWIAHELVDQGRNTAAGSCKAGIFVKALASVGEV